LTAIQKSKKCTTLNAGEMSVKLVQSKLGRIVFARLYEDEDLLETINQAAKQSKVSTGMFTLIGTLKKATVGFYRAGKYETIRLDEPLEIVSCTGNISLKEGKPFAHAHIALSDEKGEVKGGHVMAGCIIGATGELVLIEAADLRLRRKLDERTQLSLLSMEK
jgi:predicted DNA-binding protein with PD1-like motif